MRSSSTPLIGDYITKVNAVLERQILPGLTIYKGIASVPFLNPCAQRQGPPDLLKNQVHPSSVDALAGATGTVALRNLAHGGKASSVNDFLKNDSKNLYALPGNQCRGALEVFENRIGRTSGRMAE